MSRPGSTDAHAALADPGLRRRVDAPGFSPQDALEVMTEAAGVLDRPDDLALLDDAALFFGFARRGPVDPGELVAETSLQRAILSVWRAGDSWHVVDGRLAS